MKKKVQRTPALTSRDMEMLSFIWKWKFLSTAYLVHRYFPTKFGFDTAYRRLNQLQYRGLVELNLLNQEKFVWSISKKGFLLIKDTMPENIDLSYKSESPLHDYWVSTIHLGPWSTIQQDVQLVSEQELRAFPMEANPHWLPRTQAHRPDGYWYLGSEGKRKLIALEVELNQKNEDRYIAVARFYRDCTEISRVVWVVMDMAFASSLERKFKEATSNIFGMHNFVLLEDLKKLGWLAPIRIGLEKNFPLFKLTVPKLSQSRLNCGTLLNSDCRKKPYDLVPCSTSKNFKIPDRSAYSASLIDPSPSTQAIDLSSNSPFVLSKRPAAKYPSNNEVITYEGS